MTDLVGCWGEHVSIDMRAGNERVLDKDAIILWGEDLIEAIKMEMWKDQRNPLVVHFGKDDKAGWTYSCLITTSNICGHFCDQSGDAYIDVFSCRSIDPAIVKNITEKWFHPEEMVVRKVIRGAW
jgi:S-adenosylmethionine/arginine decarboxylase-like enzyme